MFLAFFISALLAMSTAISAGSLPNRQIVEKNICGDDDYPDPTAFWWSPQDREPPKCERTGIRNYTPKHKGRGFDILKLESEACFVSDEAYRLLDNIIDKVLERVAGADNQSRPQGEVERVLALSQATSDVLTDMGFALWVPTESLSDALATRRTDRYKYRHIFDCDTGSYILLTVADVLGVTANLVEITLPSGNQHNYVRWPVGGDRSVDWDMNLRKQCVTPSHSGLPYQGKNLSQEQVTAYVLSLRGGLWQRRQAFSQAVPDYLKAMSTFPERPGAYNGFAWLVATKVFPGRDNYRAEALAAAKTAVSIRLHSDYLDTLACVHALLGDFASAKETEKTALDRLEKEPRQDAAKFEKTRAAFRARLDSFEVRKDCTGLE